MNVTAIQYVRQNGLKYYQSDASFNRQRRRIQKRELKAKLKRLQAQRKAA